MGKIIQLDEILTNKIAAGEVVERPASVIKELVENSIDANSTVIEVEVFEAGLEKIRVIDNGEGMDEDDVLKAFERHATSKIKDENDLFHIRTLGFRGEALPSIASVSRLEVVTSTGENAGSRLVIEGGKKILFEKAASRKGTDITVSDLFFNTPARLKYVKTIHTELANITDLMNRLALAHPHIAMKLTHNGRILLQTNGNGDVRQVLAAIYGVSNVKKMIPIDEENLDFQIKGYISLPELNRASRNYISTIVNGRFIKNYGLANAVIQGYHTLLPIGRYPIVFLHIKLDPVLLDVNVHPQKLEVRLSKEKELYDFIQTTIEQALQKQSLIPSGTDSFQTKKTKSEQIQFTLDHIGKKLENGYGNYLNKKEQQVVKTWLSHLKEDGKQNEEKFNINKWQNPIHEGTASNVYGNINGSQTNHLPFEIDEATVAMESDEKQKLNSTDLSSSNQKENHPSHEDNSQVHSFKLDKNEDDQLAVYEDDDHLSDAKEFNQLTTVAADDRFPPLYPIGQMHGTYILAQNENGLYIIDQHAAQERIKYEYYYEKLGKVTNEWQELLIPITLEFSNDEYIKIEEHIDVLKKFGLNLEPFGTNTFIIHSHPQWFPKGEEKETIEAMIEQIIAMKKIDISRLREDLAITMSCKRSIKANHHLRNDEIQELLDSLRQTKNPFTCPHGRPIMIHYSTYQLEKMFKRVM